MNNARLLLDAELKAQTAPPRTYEEICARLNFYSGFNPKTKESICEKIRVGLPALTDVSVRVKDRYYVSIFFRMGGEQKHFYYPPR